MSSIFGLFHLNNHPVPEQKLVTMQSAMALSSPDKTHFIVDQNMGFGQLLHYNTPESLHESLPVKAGNNHLFTAAARLDNRDTLCDRFDIPHAERPTTPDSDLIWRAYEKWGEDCPDHLIGDWSFAVWNPQAQRLFIARDHHGNTAVYYYRDHNQFAFASSKKGLLALGAPRRLNELYLAQVITSWPDYHGERTIDLDIFRLPPAHAMTVTPNEVRTWRYWRLEDTPLLQLPSFEAYVEGFLEVYTEAVRCRLRSHRPIGTTLSGGLDSGSVTALAARELQKQGKTLTAFTSVPLHDTSQTVGANRFGDETAFAKMTANTYDNIAHHFITAQHVSPVAGLQKVLAIRDEPGHAGANYFWIVALLQQAQEQGLGTLLTGQGGNATVSWVGAPNLSSPLKIIQTQGLKAALKPFMPAPILRTIQLMNLKPRDWDRSAIHPDFVNKMQLQHKYIESESQQRNASYRWRNPIDRRLSVIKPGASLACALWDEMGEAFGLEIRDPTLDKRVMTYTLSIPDHHFVGENGLDRRIIREAMAGILPDKVRLNQKRGLQAADIGYRLRDSADEVEAALNALSQTEAADYLDLKKIREAFTNVLTDVNKNNTNLAGIVLLRGLDAALFIESQKNADYSGNFAALT